MSHDILFRWLVLRLLALIVRGLYRERELSTREWGVLARADHEAEQLAHGDLSRAPEPIEG